MDFLLLPSHRGEPPMEVPTTPYVCVERYDLGPWLSYPDRKGRPISAWNGMDFDQAEYIRSERVKDTATSSEELEQFIQSWAFFGLLAEFIGINLKGSEEDNLIPKNSQVILDHMYETTVVQREYGKKIIVMDWDYLESSCEMMILILPKDPAAQKERYAHLSTCLSYAYSMLLNVPEDFDHAVKYSIYALGEFLMETVRFRLESLSVPPTVGRLWGKGFLNEESKKAMLENGWCPSDITRATAKYNTLQSLHICRTLDKSLPKRDHTRCDDVSCKLYQIDMGKYEVGHQDKDCTCSPISINQEDLEKILAQGDQFPLLRLTGDTNELRVEIVDSSTNLPVTYVAISHVWADGLGNPRANSLHPCKLIKLRDQVISLTKEMPHFSNTADANPLIWLDTLCCPANDGWGKQKAIEKIRLVYRNAKHVLVLEAGLMAYDAESQDVSEQITRVFTSSWMRRLWTLQEGALAQSLYFQFSDRAVSLADLGNSIMKESKRSMRHRVILMDFLKEFLGVASFFSSYNNTPPTLSLLDDSLKHRGVSVLTDEPLCIGTLMSLDLAAILAVAPKENRMQKFWDLIAAKQGGIPSQIIFFEEQRLKASGYGWAPQSFLEMERGIHDLHSRMVRWNDPRLAPITPKGLRVRYPGYVITGIDDYRDLRPRNPLPGFQRISESYIHFRDTKTGQWTRIADKGQLTYDKHELFPLHRIADTGRLAIIINRVERVLEAVFGEVVSEQATPPSLFALLKQYVGLSKPPIHVKTKLCVMVEHLIPDEGHLYDTVRKLALELRGDPLTDHHLEIYHRLAQGCERVGADLKDAMVNDEEMKASVLELKEKMKDMMREAISTDERLRNSIIRFFGESFLDSLWVLIYDFYNHDYVGRALEEDQVWFVD